MREINKQSMAEAAAVVHTSRETWWRWEKAKTDMSLAEWELYLIKTGHRKP